MIRRLSILILTMPVLAGAEDNAVFSYVLQLPASVKTVLIAESETATLYRLRNSDNGLRLSDARRMSVGQNGVGKQRSGDQRTPLGIYFVVEELDTTHLHEKYGPVAFPLDYPNAWDVANHRTGSGIWIHGVAPDSGLRPDRDTDGCIALPNEELLALQQYLAPLETPVIVTRVAQRLSRQEVNQRRDALLAAVTLWASSYREGDWHRFLSLYADDFQYRGMNSEEWATYRAGTVGDRRIEDFEIDEIMLLADPEEPGLYLSRFRQIVVEPDQTVATLKRLYWRTTEEGTLRIVAEDNG
jgi:murein L,D-transpeptidase YafK